MLAIYNLHSSESALKSALTQSCSPTEKQRTIIFSHQVNNSGFAPYLFVHIELEVLL